MKSRLEKQLEDLTLEEIVPDKVYRLTHHYHNLLYIRYIHEQQGLHSINTPFGEELKRIDRLWHKLMEREHQQGGHFSEQKELLK